MKKLLAFIICLMATVCANAQDDMYVKIDKAESEIVSKITSGYDSLRFVLMSKFHPSGYSNDKKHHFAFHKYTECPDQKFCKECINEVYMHGKEVSHNNEHGHTINLKGGYAFIDTCPKCQKELKELGYRLFEKLCEKRRFRYEVYKSSLERRERIKIEKQENELIDKYMKKG